MGSIDQRPILIIGSGVSGLLLAQHLRKSSVPFRLYERDSDLTTRGLGWGLTLHWSLPAVRSLLPEDLVSRLPEAYVDRSAVEEGRPSTFPFFDLSTGELKASTPNTDESQRIRVSRDKFRRLLATGLDIQWGKGATGKVETDEQDGSVRVHFGDGTISEKGSIVVACDGGSSRLRQALFPGSEKFKIPVRLMGVKVECTPEEIEPLRKLDPYFLQGAASENDTFVYFSTLDAPGNGTGSDTYTCQIVVSWPIRDNFFNSASPIPFPETNLESIQLIKTFASTWAEPFRSLALQIPEQTTEVKCLDLYDWPPPKNLRTAGKVVLVGDALHPMAMYRGEGANHAIIDVKEFVDTVLPHLGDSQTGLRKALDAYEDTAVARTRPAVLASRQACLDAHEWEKIGPASPLLSKRAMNVGFDEGTMKLIV
ncbi:hypothetical protein B0T21DRAFT_411636 [Apiosordaria backusii]|uniref:FAD-binding domain-containing protein n=1 Tax=Apiosordaria backusii TaxID=314023 RepID=A0AA40ECL6_9PEZI|nr:hypothetical protein B0T21DRAFT_411636 [Apiosordaria backusii]